MDGRYKLLLIIIAAIVLFTLFYYIDNVVLSRMLGTQDFNRFGIAFILIIIFIGMVVGITRADC